MLSVEAVDLYYGASHALRRVSLTAKKGEVTCILGRNGVGKTSLLRAICGLTGIVCSLSSLRVGLPKENGGQHKRNILDSRERCHSTHHFVTPAVNVAWRLLSSASWKRTG